MTPLAPCSAVGSRRALSAAVEAARAEWEALLLRGAPLREAQAAHRRLQDMEARLKAFDAEAWRARMARIYGHSHGDA